jgi:hypothetical protein
MVCETQAPQANQHVDSDHSGINDLALAHLETDQRGIWHDEGKSPPNIDVAVIFLGLTPDKQQSIGNEDAHTWEQH